VPRLPIACRFSGPSLVSLDIPDFLLTPLLPPLKVDRQYSLAIVSPRFLGAFGSPMLRFFFSHSAPCAELSSAFRSPKKEGEFSVLGDLPSPI